MIAFYEIRDSDLHVSHSQSMTFQPHLHVQLELIYVQSGRMEVAVGEESRLLGPGDFTAAFPNAVHGYFTPPEDESTAILVICRPSLTGSWQSRILQFAPRDPFLPAKRVHPDIPFAMEALLAEQEPSPELSKALLQLILARATPEMTLERHTASDSGIIYQLVRHVSQHFSQPMTLEGLAEELGVSKFYLSRIFSTKLRTTFSDYVNSFRVDMARNLLETGSMTILDICFACGFDSHRTFNRAFRRFCGMSPREYRNSFIKK